MGPYLAQLLKELANLETAVKYKRIAIDKNQCGASAWQDTRQGRLEIALAEKQNNFLLVIST
jgi:hypothetical protein